MISAYNNSNSYAGRSVKEEVDYDVESSRIFVKEEPVMGMRDLNDLSDIDMSEWPDTKKKKKKKSRYPEGTVFINGKAYLPGEIIPRPKKKYADGEIIPRKNLQNKVVPISAGIPDTTKVVKHIAENINREKETKRLTKELYELYAKREHIVEVLRKITYKKHKNVGVGAEMNYKLSRIDERILEIESVIGQRKYYKIGKVKQFIIRTKNKIKKTFKRIRKNISDETREALANIGKIFIPLVIPVIFARMLKSA